MSVTLDYRRLTDRALVLYVLIVAALLYVLVLGPRIQGTRRWILLGPVQFQPSEFAKLVSALLLAKIFAESKRDSLGVREILGPGMTVALLALLIAAEPDLGTAFCMLPPFLAVAFLGGLRPKAIAAIAGALILVGGLGWHFALKDYQKNRIYTFLDPSLDPKGAGYQKVQSQIAVGSGGLSGKGYKNGSQSQLGYLPARLRRRDDPAAALPPRSLAMSRDRARDPGPRGGLPGRGDHGRAGLPGRVQCRDGGGIGARQGAPASVHELWRLLGHLFIPGRRSHPQRPDAALRQLSLRGAR